MTLSSDGVTPTTLDEEAMLLLARVYEYILGDQWGQPEVDEKELEDERKNQRRAVG